MKKEYGINEKEAKEIREKIKTVKSKAVYRKLEAMALLGDGYTPEEVADITKYNKNYVKILGCQFHKKGLENFATDGRKGGNHCVMPEKDAKEFLGKYEERALKGEIITITEIAQALNEVTNKERRSLSTAYSFIERHGWRKIMPRSQHPKKASDEEIKASKKKSAQKFKN